jgi:hypothetical protein
METDIWRMGGSIYTTTFELLAVLEKGKAKSTDFQRKKFSAYDVYTFRRKKHLLAFFLKI